MSVIVTASEILAQYAGAVATIAGTVLGALATLFIQNFLPDKSKVTVRYYAGYLENRLLGGDLSLESKLTRTYDISEEVELSELSNELWERFGSQPTGMNDHFEFTRDRSGVSYDIDVRLTHEERNPTQLEFRNTDSPTFETDGGTERVVTSVRVEVSSILPYSDLRNLLFRAYDLQRDIESEIPADTEGGTYSMTADTGKPPVINGLLSQMEFTAMTASSEMLEFECREGEFVVRNLENGEVDQMIDMVHKMVTIFS